LYDETGSPEPKVGRAEAQHNYT